MVTMMASCSITLSSTGKSIGGNDGTNALGSEAAWNCGCTDAAADGVAGDVVDNGGTANRDDRTLFCGGI